MTEPQIACVIGWPIAHSRSPAMHNAAYRHLGLKVWTYVPLGIKDPKQLKDALFGLRALGFRGVNVTVPYKEKVLPYLDEIAGAAQEMGAVNTIVISEDRMVGYNTDGDGFINHLKEHHLTPSECRVAIIGAGGSARALVYALLQNGCCDISIINRTEEKAKAIVERLSWYSANVRAVPFSHDSFVKLNEANLIINTTSLGLKDISEMPWPKDIAFRKGQVVYDLIYNPKTALLQKAEKDGAMAISGLGMLVHQGALAFKLFTGINPPIEIMREAAFG